MKKILTTISMGLLCFPMIASDVLYVRQNDGDSQLNISAIKEITFPDGNVVVTMNDGAITTYPSTTFVSLRFDGNVATGAINNLQADGDGIIYNGETIVSSLDGGIMIYSADGRLVLSTDGSELNVSALSNGIYVVKSGGLTSKIVK